MHPGSCARRVLFAAMLVSLSTCARAAATAPDTAHGMSGPEARIIHDPSCFTQVLVPRAGVATVRLARGFLRAGSDSVWSRQGAWLAGRDYRLDRLRGDLRLLRALPPGDTVWVRACGLVAPPALEYQRQVYRPAPASGPADTAAGRPALVATARPGTARDLGLAPAGAALAVTGN